MIRKWYYCAISAYFPSSAVLARKFKLVVKNRESLFISIWQKSSNFLTFVRAFSLKSFKFFWFCFEKQIRMKLWIKINFWKISERLWINLEHLWNILKHFWNPLEHSWNTLESTFKGFQIFNHQFCFKWNIFYLLFSKFFAFLKLIFRNEFQIKVKS